MSAASSLDPVVRPPETMMQRLISRLRWIGRNYGSTITGQGLTLGLGIVTGILSARLLGPTGRGEYAAVTLWPLGIAMFLAVGLNQAIAFSLRRGTFTIDEVATASSVIAVVQGLASVLIGLAVVPLVLRHYDAATRHIGMAFVLFTPFLIAGGYPTNVFQGRNQLGMFNKLRLIAPVTYFAGLVWLSLSAEHGLGRVVSAQVAGFCLAFFIGVVCVAVYVRPHWRWNPLAWRSLLHFGSRTQATNIANYFNQRVDQLILSLFVPPKELGLYVVAVTLSGALNVVPQAIGIVTFSKGAGQAGNDSRRTIAVSMQLASLWLVAGCAVLYVLTPFLIVHVFGPRFEGSILACKILIPGAFMLGVNQVLYNGASALGRPGLPSIAEGISMAVTAIGLYLFVPKYGYVGAAAVSTVAYTVSFVVMLVLYKFVMNVEVMSFLPFRGRIAAARTKA